jgi:hypothetical protein
VNAQRFLPYPSTFSVKGRGHSKHAHTTVLSECATPSALPSAVRLLDPIQSTFRFRFRTHDPPMLHVHVAIQGAHHEARVPSRGGHTRGHRRHGANHAVKGEQGGVAKGARRLQWGRGVLGCAGLSEKVGRGGGGCGLRTTRTHRVCSPHLHRAVIPTCDYAAVRQDAQGLNLRGSSWGGNGKDGRYLLPRQRMVAGSAVTECNHGVFAREGLAEHQQGHAHNNEQGAIAAVVEPWRRAEAPRHRAAHPTDGCGNASHQTRQARTPPSCPGISSEDSWYCNTSSNMATGINRHPRDRPEEQRSGMAWPEKRQPSNFSPCVGEKCSAKSGA